MLGLVFVGLLATGVPSTLLKTNDVLAPSDAINATVSNVSSPATQPQSQTESLNVTANVSANISAVSEKLSETGGNVSSALDTSTVSANISDSNATKEHLSIAAISLSLKFEDIREDYDVESAPTAPVDLSVGMSAQGVCGDPEFVAQAGDPNTLHVWSYFDSDAKPDPVNYFTETWRRNIDTAPENFHHVTPSNIRRFLSPCDLPQNFNQIEQRTTKSDIVRVALIWRYGGVYLDVSTIVYPSHGLGINNMWREITSGGRTAAACHDSEMPNKYDYVEDYFLMAKRGNNVFAQWHAKQLEVFGRRTSYGGVVDDNPGFYVNRNFKFPDALDYFALSNMMVMNLGSRDAAVADEISNRWILLDWNRCLDNHFRLKNSGMTLVTPLDDRQTRELDARGVGAFDKFTSFSHVVKDFNTRYPNPSRGDVLNDRTTLRGLLAKAGVR